MTRTWGVLVLSFQNRIENTVLMATLKLCNALKQQIAANHFLIKWGPWGVFVYKFGTPIRGTFVCFGGTFLQIHKALCKKGHPL